MSLGRDLHIKIRDVMDDHNVAVKTLIDVTGYAKTSIYDFLSGVHQSVDIAIAVIEALYEITGDCRLLPVGRRKVIITAIDERNMPTVKMISEHTDGFSAIVKSLGNVWADGRITEQDKKAAGEYVAAADRYIDLLIQSRQAITNTLNNTSPP
jgi:hypothetical protein